MKTKNLIKLICILLIVAGIGAWALNGFTVWIYRFKPWSELVPLGLDIKGGVVAVYQVEPAEGVDFEEGMTEIKSIMESRLSQKGYTEAVVTRQGTDRIRVEIPDIESPDEAIELVGTPGELEFTDSDGKVWVTGDHLTSASYGGLSDGEYLVLLEFDETGTTLFAEATTANVGETLNIVLDGVTKSSPTVDSAITSGEASITCSTEADAKYIAAVLQSGAMPLTLTELEAKTVSATLGDLALNKALIAGLIGLIAVMLYMIAWYRMQGVVADISLTIYMLIFYWFVSNFPWIQLTLPAIAGIILSIGMAVDANVVIYERIKDEYKSGQSLLNSINIGFSKAYSAIIDSNVTTIIAAIVMLIFGPSPVKNFAVTLFAGVALSMFTAVFVSKKILMLFVNAGMTSPKLLGLKRGEQDENR